MKDTYLVQRLTKPPMTKFLAKAEQVFGGGMLQLSPTAWKLLQTIFGIDYMGAAEYEFGSLPASLQQFVQKPEELETHVLVLKPNEIKPNYMREVAARDARRKELVEAKQQGKRAKKASPFAPPNEATIYILCRKQHLEEVIKRIRLLAKDEIRVKCGANFTHALDPASDYDRRVCGWYELDNGFFFFLDKVMWEKAVRLFKDGEYDDEVFEEGSR